MDAFEDDGEDFEVNSLVNSEPVKVLIVLSKVGARVEIEHSTKSEVLDPLEFCKVR